MKTRKISEQEADQIKSTEESHFFEKKSIGVSGASVQKAVVAFANSDGGELIIGVADDSPNWAGASTIEALNGLLQAVFDISPQPNVVYEFLKCEDEQGYVLRVSIEKSSDVHKTSDEKVYVRHGAQSIPIKDPQKIMELTFAKGAQSYEDQVLSDIVPESIIESEEIKKFLEGYSPKTDPLDFVLGQNLFDARSWDPRVVSTLLFHVNPSTVNPKKCAIKIARYETKEDDPEREHLANQMTIEGPANEIIKEAIQSVEEIMSSIKVWTADGLKSLSYPPEAIWEVIANAVIHRDYSISDDIQIFIYDNRIEILSPGKLPGYVTLENILEARYSRNPKLVRTLNRYKNPPNKDLGEGLNTTFQKMKEWGLKSPIITEEGNYIKVTLPHSPLATPSEAIMKFLQNNSKITNQQARDLTGIRSENLVKIEFYKLRDGGLIEKVPELKGPKSAWRLTEKGKAYNAEEK